ncbi:serine/threonine protein kinase [Mariniblastus sp.]|nr:serine/threonine protein kinase [Mariniblastus sp.]
MTNRKIDEEAIFHIARDLANAAKQSEYLQQVCGGDQELRERIQGLLDAHEKEQTFLKSNVQLETTAAKTPTAGAKSGSIAKPGEEIGRFKLLQQIGEGGFGVVFMAEQHKPIRRKVALKVIKPGMDTKGVVARFEAERQALAMMDHPNIAKVLDGGTTDSGRPYFVMELVKGVPITDYCDQNQLPADQRLELFITVCKAVQHAHQKGIIHRDLKPSNILVTLHDGTPVVKVIDFGVAKAVNQQLTDKTLYTAFGQMVGTPQYMSPEQAEISGLDIDTRSDVYSLGVILYELLTGSTPLETDQLRKAGYAEIQRLVKESEPQRPSTRLSTSGEKLTAIAKHRSVAPDRLSALIRGDLDWVVMKALEKDRNRRYSTPVELADDVNRYLTKEPVEAYPPSSVYKMKKFVRRNRGLVLAASAFAVIMITATTVSIWNRNAAVAARDEAKEALDAEKEALVEAEKALAAYRNLLLEQALAAAFNTDKKEISRVCKQWQDANFEPEMIYLFKGLHEQNNGAPEEAAELIRKAYLQNPNSIPIMAAYKILYSKQFRSNGSSKESEELGIKINEWMKNTERSSDFEDVLIGWSYIHTDPAKAQKLLKLDSDRRWPIRRVMYAHALALTAAADGNSRMAEQALKELNLANKWLVEENPLALPTELFVLTVACSLNDGLNDEDKVRAEEIAEKLKDNLSDYFLADGITYLYYRVTENTAIIKELHESDDHDHLGHLGHLQSAYYFRTGNNEKALQFLKRDSKFRLPRIVSACVAAELKMGKEARECYQQIKENSNTRLVDNALALNILLYLGDLEEAAQEAKAQKTSLDEIGYKKPFMSLKLRLDLIANSDLSVEELAEKFRADINESETAKCAGNYLLGLIACAKGKPDLAKTHFEAAVNTKQFIYHDCEMAKALLARGINSTDDEK